MASSAFSKGVAWRKTLVLLLPPCLFMAIAACQPMVQIIARAGDDGLVWPLPPAAARLYYDGSLDLVARLTLPLRIITGQGTDPSQLQTPLRVAARGSLIAVVERVRGQVQVYDRVGNRTFTLQAETGGPLLAIRDVAIDEFQRIYVAESVPARISVYNNHGELLNRFGSPSLWTKPARIALDLPRGLLYVADLFLGSIYIFTQEGAFLLDFGERGQGPGQFTNLADLGADHRGNILTIETSPPRMQRFSPQGKWLNTIVMGDGKDTVPEPVALALEPDGTLYLADRYREAVVILDPEGKTITTIGGLGRDPGRFNGLADIAFDPEAGRLYTCETGSSRLQMFRRSTVAWGPYP